MAHVPTASAASAPNPRLGRVLREAGWIFCLAAGIYLVLVLASYDANDPSPFFSRTGESVANKGGAAGAFLSSTLLYMFGRSAWWWVALAAFGILRFYARLERWEMLNRHTLAVSLIGFALLLASSCALEAMRMYSDAAWLPARAGGALGDVLASLIQGLLGFIGGTLVLMGTAAAALSLFTGLSWIRLAEALGGALEWTYETVRGRIEARRDREEGRLAAQVREEKVEEAKKLFEDHEPLRIEMAAVEVPKSERVVREKQVPLFADLPDSPLPPVNLLDAPEAHVERPTPETLEYTSRLIERKLSDFSVQVKVVAAYPGPVITRFEVEPAVGVKGAQVVNLARDLARALSVTAIRVVETIPGTSCMGLEIPNPKREIVRLSEIVGSQAYADTHSRLALALGKDITGKPVVVDLQRMPHLLVAGTTGSGKSVAINAMILSLLYKTSANDVKLILIDPKMLELSAYEGIPHLVAPVVTDKIGRAHV